MSETPPLELFEPFDRLVEIDVGGQTLQVPERNALLRCFQYVNVSAISCGNFCWSGECTNCKVWYQRPGEPTERPGLSCRLRVQEGMKIVRLSRHIKLT